MELDEVLQAHQLEGHHQRLRSGIGALPQRWFRVASVVRVCGGDQLVAQAHESGVDVANELTARTGAGEPGIARLGDSCPYGGGGEEAYWHQPAGDEREAQPGYRQL